MPKYTPTQLRSQLRAAVARYDTQRDAAAAIGISQQYLCDVLKGRKSISTAPAILRFLGVKAAVVYTRE